MKILAQTKYRSLVKPVTDTITLLRPASNNTKLGNGKTIISKGKLRGLPLYSLTLEERATCPSDCFHWKSCYGSPVGKAGGMYMADRFKHGRPLTIKLSQELEALNKKHKKGFLIRLHVLGDFYSVGYVKYWASKLKRYPRLHVFGYSARLKGKIHEELQRTRRLYQDRWMVRYSTNESYRKESPYKMYAVREEFKGTNIVCPSQEGKVDACLDCALCWSPGFKKSIKFLTH